MYDFLLAEPKQKYLKRSYRILKKIESRRGSEADLLIEKSLYCAKMHGIDLSLRDGQAISGNQPISAPPLFVQDFQDSLKAYQKYGAKKISTSQQLRDLRKMFKTCDVRSADGSYRQHTTRIGFEEGASNWKFGPAENVAERLEELLSWKKKTSLDRVTVAVIFWARLLDIHPFCDGNGRVSRVTMNAILSEEIGSLVHGFGFEKYLYRRRKFLKRNLHEVMLKKNSLDPALEFFLQVFEDTLSIPRGEK